MKQKMARLACSVALGCILGVPAGNAATTALVGWPAESLHEMDGSDVSVYSLAPPYSTIHAQLMVGGLLVRNDTGVTVTYQAVADASGSINSSSLGKGSFYQYAQLLYGVPLGPDQGLGGFAMPGMFNQAQTMTFDPTQNCFTGTGIPVMPYDDQGRKNYFPMMRLIARNGEGAVLAQTDIALPVTDEMTCVACHSSGSDPVGRPNTGWAWDSDPDRDYKLNILRNHDDHFLGAALYTSTLSQAGYNKNGLNATVTQDGKPVLCLRCHKSNALPGTGIDPVTPMTLVMHIKHSFVYDPDQQVTLNQMSDSSACFRCHAGPEARSLRGAHHSLSTTSGGLAMTCQSCHGKMSDVGKVGRQGWIDQPVCQSCHSGTILAATGQLRYTNVFDAAGNIRQALDQTFATQQKPNPSNLSSYAGSQGHGGLSCAACHGAAHAEWASSQPNEQVQPQRLQGSPGVLINCVACHTNNPSTITGGPHGLHPIDSNWASHHNDIIGEAGNNAACRACHGLDFTGTMLSRSKIDHTFSELGSIHYWPGYQSGCYNCHIGPFSSVRNTNSPATAASLIASTPMNTPVSIALVASDPANDLMTYRIISAPAHGRVSLNGAIATYFPATGFLGQEAFTYSAWNGSKDSNLGQVAVTVAPGDCALTAAVAVPIAALPNRLIPLRAAASVAGCGSPISYDWDFGDGSAHSTNASPNHVYPTAGDYPWVLTVRAGTATASTNGVITISSTLGPPLAVGLTDFVSLLQLSWRWDPIPVALEVSYDLGDPFGWHPVLNPPFVDFDSVNMNFYVYPQPGPQFFRLRRVP